MTGKKILCKWLGDYSCRKKYKQCIERILTQKDETSIISGCNINTTRLSLLVLHDIVVSSFEIPRFFTAVSIVNDIYDALPRELMNFKLFAKVTTGLKILALFEMLRKGNKLVLPKLNEFFPRTGIEHPKADKKLAEKLSIAQLRFRKFLLSLIANKVEQAKYLQSGYKQEYGKNFQDKVKDLVAQFINVVDESLPLTMIEKLSSVQVGSKLHSELGGLTSPVANLMLDMLYEKKYLTQDEVMELIEAFESEKETDSDRNRKDQHDIPITGNRENKRQHVESPNRRLANLKKPKINESQLANSQEVTHIDETKQVEKDVQIYNCSVECAPNASVPREFTSTTKKTIPMERGRVYKMNFKTTTKKTSKISQRNEDKAATSYNGIDTYSDIEQETCNKTLHKMSIPANLAAKFAEFIKSEQSNYLEKVDAGSAANSGLGNAYTITPSPNSFFQAGFIDFLKSQGISGITDSPVPPDNTRKTPEQVQTVSSSSEQETASQKTPVSSHSQQLQLHQQSEEVFNGILEQNKDTVCSHKRQQNSDLLNNTVHQNNIKFNDTEKTKYHTDNEFTSGNTHSKKDQYSALSLSENEGIVRKLNYSENKNLPNCERCRCTNGNNPLSHADKSNIETSPTLFVSQLSSESTSPTSFYSCYGTPQVQQLQSVSDEEPDMIKLQNTWHDSPLIRQRSRNESPNSGSVVEDSDATSDETTNSPLVLPSSYSVDQYDALAMNVFSKSSLPELNKYLKNPVCKLCIVKLYRDETLDKVDDMDYMFEMYS